MIMRRTLLALTVLIVGIILLYWAGNTWPVVSSHLFLFAWLAGVVCFFAILILASRKPQKMPPDRLLTTLRPKPPAASAPPMAEPPHKPTPPMAAPPVPKLPTRPAQSSRTYAGTVTYAPPSAIREAGFISYFPRTVHPDEWNTLLVYLFARGAIIGVAGDARRRFEGGEDTITSASTTKTAFLAPGTSVLIVPQYGAIEFNPPQLTVTWLEDFHCAEFRFRALARFADRIDGRIGFYVPPLLIGEIEFTINLERSPASTTPDMPPAHATAAPYQRIFVSYSHADSNIADSLQRAYKALGNEYLRDIDILRSGEEWNPALLRHIDEAEIFQLLWSQAAERSKYVRQEWQRALSLHRKQFIRPVYWKQPMPPPPPELAAIHFAYIEL